MLHPHGHQMRVDWWGSLMHRRGGSGENQGGTRGATKGLWIDDVF
jgi:hypothetical protein